MLIASGVLLMAAPRADQTLLDGIEAALPATHDLYFSRTEAAVFREAQEEAARHAGEAERLNAVEARSRAGGAALDETEVRKLSSYVRSYAEMRNGELFVMGEVRGRARERARWWLGPLLAVLGLVALPGGVGRWMSRRWSGAARSPARHCEEPERRRSNLRRRLMRN